MENRPSWLADGDLPGQGYYKAVHHIHRLKGVQGTTRTRQSGWLEQQYLYELLQLLVLDSEMEGSHRQEYYIQKALQYMEKLYGEALTCEEEPFAVIRRSNPEKVRV